MKKILICLALLVPLYLRANSAIADDDAGAGNGSSLGSGSDTGSGSAVAPTPAPAPTPAVAPVHNPATDPAGYISDLENAKKTGWPLLVLVGFFGLCEILALAGKNVPFFAWLGTGRVSVVIGGFAALTASMINTLADGGTWSSVLIGALAPAIALFLHPAATDVAIAIAAKKTA